MDYAKTLKLRCRVGYRNLQERRKRYTSSREEGEDAHMCPCGKATEYNSACVVGQRKMFKAECHVLRG